MQYLLSAVQIDNGIVGATVYHLPNLLFLRHAEDEARNNKSRGVADVGRPSSGVFTGV
jgi:hypothetical protein